MKRIGVIGSGFTGKGFGRLLEYLDDMQLSKVLTRSNITQRNDFFANDRLTNSLDELIDCSDLIVECTGDCVHASQTVPKILDAGIPVVTTNAEFHVTTGSYFVGKGLLTEAEGDQPGCTAALYEEAVSMGFDPLVLGNVKGFINYNPSEEDMRYWGAKNNLSLPMVTSFTDGTKVQIEQAFVANYFGFDIATQGMLGYKAEDLKSGGDMLAQTAQKQNLRISDYLLAPKGPAGVFVTATHQEALKDDLRYFKMGDGPFYTLVKPYHLVYLEMPKTIRRVFEKGEILLDNGKNPTISVCSLAKKELAAGTAIKSAIGSFEVRGECIRIKEHPNHVPIALLRDAVLKRKIEPNQIITFDDVDLEPNIGLEIWKKLHG